MTHILSKLSEEYENVVENLEDRLDDDIDMLIIKGFGTSYHPSTIEWMRNPIKTKENNKGRHYTYTKSRERAETVVNMGTRVDILQRESKSSTMRTKKKMYT